MQAVRVAFLGDLMTRIPLSKVVLAVVLAVILAVPSLPAANSRPLAARPPVGVASSVNEALLQLWRSVVGFWAKVSGNPTAPSDAGCGLDPSGRCGAGLASPSPLDEGCGLDPDGRCANGH
jgi:hypothetical protein